MKYVFSVRAGINALDDAWLGHGPVCIRYRWGSLRPNLSPSAELQVRTRVAIVAWLSLTVRFRRALQSLTSAPASLSHLERINKVIWKRLAKRSSMLSHADMVPYQHGRHLPSDCRSDDKLEQSTMNGWRVSASLSNPQWAVGASV